MLCAGPAGLALASIDGQSVKGWAYEQTKAAIQAAPRPVALSFVTTGASGDAAGRDLLLRVGLAVLSLCSREILATSDPHELNEVFRAAPNQLFDADALITLALNPKWVVPHELRQAHQDEIDEEQQQVDESRIYRETREMLRAAEVAAERRVAAVFQESAAHVEHVVWGGESCALRLPDQQVHRGVLLLAIIVTTSSW